MELFDVRGEGDGDQGDGDQGGLVQHSLAWILASVMLLRFENEQECDNNVIL